MSLYVSTIYRLQFTTFLTLPRVGKTLIQLLTLDRTRLCQYPRARVYSRGGVVGYIPYALFHHVHRHQRQQQQQQQQHGRRTWIFSIYGVHPMAADADMKKKTNESWHEPLLAADQNGTQFPTIL
jgi:hypothetical protein